MLKTIGINIKLICVPHYKACITCNGFSVGRLSQTIFLTLHLEVVSYMKVGFIIGSVKIVGLRCLTTND
jgi:hypothetical protein